MENLKQEVTMLYAVLNDLDEIPVVGLNNQRKFLNCADGIKTAAQVILQYVSEEEANKPTVLQESGTAKDLVKKESVDG